MIGSARVWRTASLQPSIPPELAHITFSIELIGPREASALLANLYEGQRRVKVSAQKRYGRAMIEKRWCASPDTIAIDSNGKLIEGQNRMLAIVASGTMQWFAVTRGWPSETYSILGQGLPRTVTDLDASVSTTHAAIARILRTAPDCNGEPDRPTIVAVAQTHRSGIDTILGWCGTSKFPAAITTALVRALLAGVDVERLATFVGTLHSGRIKSDNDTAALTLRDFVLRERQHGRKLQSVAYLKATSAIDSFLRHQPLSRLYASEKNLFPYPVRPE